MSKRAWAGWFVLFAMGCSDGENGKDATVPAPDATAGDAGPTGPDATGMDALPDAETPGDATIEDTGADAGMTGLTEEMDPGRYVQVREARINIGNGTDPNNADVDSFGTVKTKLGAGTRSVGMNARSYEWTTSSGAKLTIWFANTNLDNDDEAPADVDDSDEVLFIAVQETYAGKTPRGIGLGSARGEVEAAAPTGYGPAPSTVTVPDPPGTFARYYRAGISVTYDTNDIVRTVTIHRAYAVEPAGDLDIGEHRLRFPGGDLSAAHGPGNLIPGSSKSDARTLLGGYPDGEGMANNLFVQSFAFLGIELVFLPNGDNVAFFSVHEPYYGVFEGTMAGVGSTRQEVEAALGLGMGEASSMSAQLICYPAMDNSPDVLVTYSNAMPPLATTFSMGFLTCP